MRKTMLRFFTIADYEEEELWLREQHRSGWRLEEVKLPCFYIFASCEPQDVIYRLDDNARQSEEYLQMAKDFGWEYFACCAGWLYFRKPAESAESEEEGELFSDPASRAERAQRVVRTRLLPLALIFLCCVIPNLLNAVNGKMSVYSGFFTVLFGILFAVYVYLIVYCGVKLRKIRDREQT